MIAEIQTFLIAMTPIGELRASIPFGLTKGVNFYLVYISSVLGNMVPVVIILTLLDPVVKFLSRYSQTFERFVDYIFEKTKKKHKKQVGRSGYWALTALTAIPLPVSGAWTASLVSYLFGLDYKDSFKSIFVGVLIAGIVVTILWKIGEFLEIVSALQFFIGVLLVGLFIRYLLKFIKKK